MQYKRVLFWVLLVSFTAGICFWFLHFPFRPDLVLRVIPEESNFVTRHMMPVDRVTTLLKGPLGEALYPLTGMSSEDMRMILEDPDFDSVLRRLCGSYVVTGYVPDFTGNSDAAFVFGSWVGGVTTHLLRGGFLDKAFSGFQVHRFQNNERIWIGHFPDFPDKFRYISFGVYEGVLAGCISSNPLGALSVLSSLRVHVHPVSLVRSWSNQRITAETPDEFRGWLQTAIGENIVYSGGVRIEGIQNLSGWCVSETTATNSALPFLFQSRSLGSLDFEADALRSKLGDVPEVMALTHVSQLVEAGVDFGLFKKENAVLDLFSNLALPTGGVCLWVSGGNYFGRVMRMKVPAVGLAFQIRSDVDNEYISKSLLDVLNSQFGLGLIAVKTKDIPSIYILNSIKGDGIYALLRPDERPAFSVVDGWFIGMTSVDVLRRMLSNAPTTGGMQPRWFLGSFQKDTWFYGWSSLAELSDVASKSLAGYALWSLMQTGNAKRFDSPQIRRVLDILEKSGELRGWLGVSEHGYPEARLELRLNEKTVERFQ